MSNQLDVCKKYPIKDFPGLLLNKIVTERIKATFCGDTLENKEELSKQKATFCGDTLENKEELSKHFTDQYVLNAVSKTSSNTKDNTCTCNKCMLTLWLFSCLQNPICTSLEKSSAQLTATEHQT